MKSEIDSNNIYDKQINNTGKSRQAFKAAVYDSMPRFSKYLKRAFSISALFLSSNDI